MDLDWLRSSCLSFPGSYEDYPFGPEMAVFRVSPGLPGERPAPGRIFALVPVDASPPSISLKCDPALAVRLRAAHPGITGAWHLNKKHWNSVRVDGRLPAETVVDLIEDSYDLIVSALPAARRSELGWSPGTR